MAVFTLDKRSRRLPARSGETPTRAAIPVGIPSACPPGSISASVAVRDSWALSWAVNRLRVQAPDLSAATPLARWQCYVPVVFAFTISFILVAWPASVPVLISGAVTTAFVFVVLIRLAALGHTLAGAREPRQAAGELLDHELPAYSVIVALYREASVVPGLVQALADLDYPADRIEVIFVTEADDIATRLALLACPLPTYMSVITVPSGLPRTKPRALNFALARATGELVTIFDAEDLPDRHQLRRAAAAFAAGDETLACVQARLTIDPNCKGFLARQFALEYATLFGAIVPALVRWRLPVPLGGTSNHFRRRHLISCGGWDPFNVTEDADLGLRLARFGLTVGVIDTETREEAPLRWRVWIGQRTRWLKGWMQTYLVHMRRPGVLWRDLGPRGFLGFQIMLGGMILSALLHPWVYVAVAYWWLTGAEMISLTAPAGRLSGGLAGWTALAAWATLILGLLSAVLLAVVTVLRSRDRHSGLRAWYVVGLPIYWLAISYAAYRAIYDLSRRPFYWEKTPHSARPVTKAGL